MRNHRNVQKEFQSLISAYADVYHDWNMIDVTIFDNAKKVKYNRLLSILGWMSKHISVFKIMLACVPWNVPHTSFRYIAEDLINISDYMRNNSGVCYIVKVNYIEDCKTVVRLIPFSKKDHVVIHTAITRCLKEEYDLGGCFHEKEYWL